MPTLVSPDSITASAPSITAFATSDASARVGRECVIIDSSICVATITGLALSRQIWTARFCTTGTCSSGISTPRSPRATITPSKARTISSSRATASGFSIFAITGRRMPTCVHHPVHELDVLGRADEGQRDEVDAEPQRELQVLGVLVRHRRHADRDAGQRQALVVADDAALGDVADHVGAVLDLDRDQRDVAVVDQQPVAGPDVVGELLVRCRHAVVGARDVLDGDPDPLTGRPLDRAVGETAEPDLRALQVGEHGDVAAGRLAAARTSWKRRPWSACTPWLKFSRATSMPASTSARHRSGVSVAGPSVHTIFARRVTPPRVGPQMRQSSASMSRRAASGTGRPSRVVT